MTVSYTHLDVYKRQVYHWVISSSSLPLALYFSTGFRNISSILEGYIMAKYHCFLEVEMIVLHLLLLVLLLYPHSYSILQCEVFEETALQDCESYSISFPSRPTPHLQMPTWVSQLSYNF